MTKLIASAIIALIAATGVWAVVALAYQQKRGDDYQAGASFLVACISVGSGIPVLAVISI